MWHGRAGKHGTTVPKFCPAAAQFMRITSPFLSTFLSRLPVPPSSANLYSFPFPVLQCGGGACASALLHQLFALGLFPSSLEAVAAVAAVLRSAVLLPLRSPFCSLFRVPSAVLPLQPFCAAPLPTAQCARSPARPSALAPLLSLSLTVSLPLVSESPPALPPCLRLSGSGGVSPNSTLHLQDPG